MFMSSIYDIQSQWKTAVLNFAPDDAPIINAQIDRLFHQNSSADIATDTLFQMIDTLFTEITLDVATRSKLRRAMDEAALEFHQTLITGEDDVLGSAWESSEDIASALFQMASVFEKDNTPEVHHISEKSQETNPKPTAKREQETPKTWTVREQRKGYSFRNSIQKIRLADSTCQLLRQQAAQACWVAAATLHNKKYWMV